MKKESTALYVLKLGLILLAITIVTFVVQIRRNNRAKAELAAKK